MLFALTVNETPSRVGAPDKNKASGNVDNAR